MAFEIGTPYEYNTNSNLDGEIKRYLTNDKNFTSKNGKIYKINRKERMNLEKILKNKKNSEINILKNTSYENLLSLKSSIIVSSATKYLRNKINNIINLDHIREKNLGNIYELNQVIENDNIPDLSNDSDNLYSKIDNFLANKQKLNGKVLITTSERRNISKEFKKYSDKEIFKIVGKDLLENLLEGVHNDQRGFKNKIRRIIRNGNNVDKKSINGNFEKIEIGNTLKEFDYRLSSLNKYKKFKGAKGKLEYNHLIGPHRKKIFKYINKFLGFLTPKNKERFANTIFFESAYGRYNYNYNKKSKTFDIGPTQINSGATYDEIKREGIVSNKEDLKDWDKNFQAAAYILKNYGMKRWNGLKKAKKAGIA